MLLNILSMHRTALTIKKYPTPNVNRAKDEKPRCMALCHMSELLHMKKELNFTIPVMSKG